MKLVPIDGTDLEAQVDDDIYAELVKLGVVFDPAYWQDEQTFNEHRTHHLAIIRGEVHLVNDKPAEPTRWLQSMPLKKWIVRPGKRRHVRYCSNRLDLRRESLLGPGDVRQCVSTLEVRVPSSRQSVWIPELQGYIPRFYARRKPRFGKYSVAPKAAAKKAKLWWQEVSYLPVFRCEQGVEEYLQARRAKKAEKRAVIEKANDASLVGWSRPLPTEPVTFIPLGTWLSPMENAWIKDRKAHAAFLVLLGVYYQCAQAGTPYYDIFYEVFKEKLNLSKSGTEDALSFLENQGMVTMNRKKGRMRKQFGNKQVLPNWPPRCTPKRMPDLSEPHGRFPVRFLGDPEFFNLSILQKVILVGLYALAQGERTRAFRIQELMDYTYVSDRETAVNALKVLHRVGFLTQFDNPSVNRHFPYTTTDLNATFREIV